MNLSVFQPSTNVDLYHLCSQGRKYEIWNYKNENGETFQNSDGLGAFCHDALLRGMKCNFPAQTILSQKK